MIRPNPAETWDLVAKFSRGQPIPPTCNLFGSSEAHAQLGGQAPMRDGKKRRR